VAHLKGVTMQHPVHEDSSDVELHFCIVTDDIARTAAWLAGLLGVPVPPIEDGPRPDVHQEYDGTSGDTDFRQAYFTWRGTGVEFIEPGPGPSSWRTHLERFGAGVHHIGVRGRDAVATGGELARMGHPSVHSGGSAAGTFAYYDTTRELGTLLELVTSTGKA